MDVIISGNKGIIQFMSEQKVFAHCIENVKISVFNYVQKNKSGYLIYNTLYNSLVRLNLVEYDMFQGKRSIEQELLEKLITHGLIIAKELDELEVYNQWASSMREKNKHYMSINITTTLKCNARCYYCYESGVRHYDFYKSQFPLLIQFFKNHVRKDDTLVLNWFGGEPLMNKTVLNFVAHELNKENIPFSSYIITNGILINKSMVDSEFVRWKVRDVQITLDGLKETYEKRKAYVDQRRNIFGRILQKIELVAKSGIHVHIRLNIDRKNRAEILELLKILNGRYGRIKAVTWYPAFLTGIGDNLTEAEKISFVKTMFEIIQNPDKMNIGSRFYSMPKSRACMRSDPRSFSVDVFGNIYNCEHLVGRSNQAIGTLMDFNDEKNLCRNNISLRDKCKKCVFLPKCMGGCEANLETNDEPCMIDKYMIQGYLAYMAEQ